MNLFQSVPETLQSTLFFKTVQNLLKLDDKGFDDQTIRHGLYMTLRVSDNKKLAEKLNSQMRKCYEHELKKKESENQSNEDEIMNDETEDFEESEDESGDQDRETKFCNKFLKAAKLAQK